MAIPLLDLLSQYETIRDEVSAAIQGVIRSGQFILGEEVEVFEDKFAAYCGADFGIGVSSGTEALHLALRALDIGEGDEVITAANSFAATAFAIAHAGATPVFVDVLPSDFNINVDLIESAISERTKAIIPVHLYGQPANMEAITAIAKKHGLRVIEDSCQAHGARIGSHTAGSFGDIGCFSFYPGKNLGAYGDGGGIVTSDPELAERLRLLRNYGQRVKNVHSVLGYNARLDTLQAAILLVKLNYLEEWNEARRQVAEWYTELLADSGLILPEEKPGFRHVYHLYVVRHPQRDALLAHLKDNGIFGGIHYPTPLPEFDVLPASRTVPEGAPVTTQLSKEILSLPIFPELERSGVEEIAKVIEGWKE